MPAPTTVLAEALPVLALVGLLVTATRRPRPAAEVVVSLVAVAVALTPGLLGRSTVDGHDLATTLGDLAPVVAFLATILVVSDVCDRAGLFAAAGQLLRPGGGQTAVRLLTTSFLLAAAVTAVLSLDATVVLLTPVVVGAARAAGVSPRPGAYACLRMANSSSLLLPVSNLTNLLALPSLSLTFLGFAATMAPVLAVVLVVEYVALRLLYRGDLAERPTVDAQAADTRATDGQAADAAAARVEAPLPVVPTAVVSAMLVGFAVTSPFGVDPWWVSAAAALVLLAWGRRLVSPRQAVRAASLPFTLFVLALGVVVAVIARGDLGGRVADLLPSSTGFGALLLIAVVATGLANLLTNLSATLLVVPLVAPVGDAAVLAALIGLNIGAGLTLTGSLANLLWRRGLAARGPTPGLGEFHRVSLLTTPFTILAATAALALVT